MAWREPAHVLIVDDDARVRATLARYFAGEGFRVDEAGDGASMRACLARGPPDLILLDLNLPGEDGLTLARELRATRAGIGIVIITGRTDVIDTVAGLEVGADDYVAKPFNLRELLARVRAVLRRPPPPGGEHRPEPAREVLRFEGWAAEPAKRKASGPDG